MFYDYKEFWISYWCAVCGFKEKIKEKHYRFSREGTPLLDARNKKCFVCGTDGMGSDVKEKKIIQKSYYMIYKDNLERILRESKNF